MCVCVCMYVCMCVYVCVRVCVKVQQVTCVNTSKNSLLGLLIKSSTKTIFEIFVNSFGSERFIRRIMIDDGCLGESLFFYGIFRTITRHYVSGVRKVFRTSAL